MLLMHKATKTLVYYEWTNLTRNRFQLISIVLTFLLGIYAIFYGNSEIEAQKRTIEAVTSIEQEEFNLYKASFKEELESLEQQQAHDIASRPSYAWYRHGYHAILHPHDFAPLAIGQRDLFRYYYRLTGMSLHYQLFENELANPVNLLAGNFDLSFVILYLFPLIIIAFLYSLFSAEKENGTLPLLQIQKYSIRKIILIRLSFYVCLLTGLAILLSLIGLFVSGNPFTTQNFIPAVAWLASVVVYCVFWFGLLFFIISFRRNSAFNAITSAACWLLFLIVIPAILNVIVNVKYPLNSVTLAGLTRRTGLENENDEKESKEVIMEFLSHKPELAASDSLINNNMLAKAYAAFTTLKDMHGEQKVNEYNTQVARRNQWTSKFHGLSPAVNTQEVLTHITETDLNTFLHFQSALSDFHTEITDFYFSRLFWDKTITLEDYDKLPEFKMPVITNRWSKVCHGIAKTLAAAAFVFLLGYINMGAYTKR